MKKIFKALIISISLFIILTFIMTFFNYISWFGLIPTKIFKVLIPFIALLSGGIFIGKQSDNKGWLEGLKFSLIFLLILFIFKLIIFHKLFIINDLFLYSLILISGTLGSILGINIKKAN